LITGHEKWARQLKPATLINPSLACRCRWEKFSQTGKPFSSGEGTGLEFASYEAGWFVSEFIFNAATSISDASNVPLG